MSMNSVVMYEIFIDNNTLYICILSYFCVILLEL